MAPSKSTRQSRLTIPQVFSLSVNPRGGSARIHWLDRAAPKDHFELSVTTTGYL